MRYDKEKFCAGANQDQGNLKESVLFMISCLKQGQFRDQCFRSLGEIALAVGEFISKYLREIIDLVKDGLSGKSRKQSTKAALGCLSDLACAVGPILQPLIDDLPGNITLSVINNYGGVGPPIRNDQKNSKI